MRFRHLLYCAVFALMPVSATAQTQTKPDIVTLPKEHEAFLDDVFAVMQKYPAAAKRFGLYDQSFGAKSQSKVPTSRAHWMCCDHPRLPDGCAFICPE